MSLPCQELHWRMRVKHWQGHMLSFQKDSRMAPHKCLRHIDHLVALICQELEGNLLVANELYMRIHIIATHSQHCMQSIA